MRGSQSRENLGEIQVGEQQGQRPSGGNHLCFEGQGRSKGLVHRRKVEGRRKWLATLSCRALQAGVSVWTGGSTDLSDHSGRPACRLGTDTDVLRVWEA